jgi:hypothetical protein
MLIVPARAAIRCAPTGARRSPPALSLSVAVLAAVARAMPRPCASLAANSHAVSLAGMNAASPAAKAASPPSTRARRPATSDNVPKTSRPGRMTRTTGTAYSRVWVSDENPKIPRSKEPALGN